MKELKDILLLDVLPDSILRDAEVEATAQALDAQLKSVSVSLDKPSVYAGFDALPGGILDHLAAQYDITVWRDDWPENVKRSVLRTAISDKRKKGTVEAVKNAVSSLGSAVTIQEWWQTSGEPCTFKIYVAQGDIDGHVAADVQVDLMASIEDSKPARAHYDFIIQQPIRGTLNACGYVRMIACARISSTVCKQVDVSGAVGVEAHARAMIMRRIVGNAEITL